MPEVTIGGVRYVPDQTHADSVAFWYMHDNHTFDKLLGKTIDAILAEADEIEACSPHGMLCVATLKCKGKEVRRVGTPVHSRGRKDPKDQWESGKAAWRKAMEADPEVMRLLASSKE